MKESEYYSVIMKLSDKDVKLLEILQKDCKRSLKDIAREIKSPVTTVYDRVKRFEKEGLVKKYVAVLDDKKLDRPFTVFIFARIAYHVPGESRPLSQREIAKEISKYPNVQGVYIISGDWDIMLKVKGKDIDEISSFVVDELRTIKGIERTYTSTCMQTVKDEMSLQLVSSVHK